MPEVPNSRLEVPVLNYPNKYQTTVVREVLVAAARFSTAVGQFESLP
jgi:hypothetical protein